MTIKKAHVIFKTHLDIGFTNYAKNVVSTYMTEYLPKAAALARQMREAASSERFIWTSGSWLIYEYLEQASADARRCMEEAILAGDIVWHALPFTTHTELMDPELFRFGLSLSQALDKRFGKHTIAAKMTDVPGHTRGIVPLLAEAGVQFLHIGVNPASTPPAVPPVFLWRDASGAELVVMYHKGSYGSAMTVPGMDEAIVFAHTGDNHGPQSAESIALSFAHIREQFPAAVVCASTMDQFAQALLRHKEHLPVVTEEIGDTWCHGLGTDPLKVAQFRTLCRLRNAWLADGRVDESTASCAAFSRSLLMVPEHTWGMDIKKHLADYTNYTPEQLQTVRNEANFKRFSQSWQEQRQYLVDAVAALDQPDLIQEAQAQLADLVAKRSKPLGKVAHPNQVYNTGRFSISFAADTGAVIHLRDNATGRSWASRQSPLAAISMENFAQADYDRFVSQYLINLDKHRDWAIPDYTKPGIDKYVQEHRIWRPQLTGITCDDGAGKHHFRLELSTPTAGVQQFGFPKEWVLDIVADEQMPELQFTLQWYGMSASRLPMAFWFSFCPDISQGADWRMDKLGQEVSPLDVISLGARHLHAVGSGVRCRDQHGSISIRTMDAPLVAPGVPSLLNFDDRLPDMSGGMHFNLYNNIWGTNFPMWYEDDGLFRFQFAITPSYS